VSTTFFVKRTVASSYTVDDLGLVIPSGVERDLALSFDLQTLQNSADLVAALNSGALLRTASAGGDTIPAAQAFDDNQVSAHAGLPFAHHPHSNKAVIDAITDAGSGVITSVAERNKLNGIEAGAQVNDTGAQIVTKLNGLAQPISLNVTQTGGATAAQLRDRATHTGTQTASTISDFNTATDTRITAQKAQVNGLASLDGTGKVPTAQIPSSALPSFDVVADAAARLALVVEEGDEAYQTDDGSQWIYDGSAWFQRPAASGNVNGPASATADAIVLFDGTTGKLLKNSAVTLVVIVQNTRQVIAGAGLTGGGDLSADRTFNVVANADGSIVVNADDVRVGVLATDAQHGSRGGGSQHAAATTSVAGFMSSTDKTQHDAMWPWGTQRQNAESLGTSTNANTTYVNKVTLTTPVLPAGRYMITWYCEVSTGTTNRDPQTRLQVDGVTQAENTNRQTVANQWESRGGTREFNLSAAAHTLALDFSRGSSSATISIRRASISIWRIS